MSYLARLAEDAQGAKVDHHCPYDEAQLRQARIEGHLICPCCWTYFPKPAEVRHD